MSDLSPPRHTLTAAIDQCAEYLAKTPPISRPTPLLPHMREMFGLSSIEICEAIRQARLIRARAA